MPDNEAADHVVHKGMEKIESDEEGDRRTESGVYNRSLALIIHDERDCFQQKYECSKVQRSLLTMHVISDR